MPHLLKRCPHVSPFVCVESFDTSDVLSDIHSCSNSTSEGAEVFFSTCSVCGSELEVSGAEAVDVVGCVGDFLDV